MPHQTTLKDIETFINIKTYYSNGINKIIQLIPKSDILIESIVTKALTSMSLHRLSEIHYSNKIFNENEKDFIRHILLAIRCFQYMNANISVNKSHVFLRNNGYFTKDDDNKKCFDLEYNKTIMSDELGKTIEKSMKDCAELEGIIDFYHSRIKIHKTLYKRLINDKIVASINVVPTDEKEIFNYVKSEIEKYPTRKIVEIPNKYFYVEFRIDSDWQVLYVDDIVVDSIKFKIIQMD